MTTAKNQRLLGAFHTLIAYTIRGVVKMGSFRNRKQKDIAASFALLIGVVVGVLAMVIFFISTLF